MIRRKGKEWIKRYLPAEIVGTITAMVAAGIANSFCPNPVIIAYVATLGEAIGFYLTILIQNVLLALKKQKSVNKKFSGTDFLKIIARLVLEFGPAGILDGLVLRPFFMYLFPILLNNFMLGIFIGKIAGDGTFYVLVILSYEIGKRKRIP